MSYIRGTVCKKKQQHNGFTFIVFLISVASQIVAYLCVSISIYQIRQNNLVTIKAPPELTGQYFSRMQIAPGTFWWSLGKLQYS